MPCDPVAEMVLQKCADDAVVRSFVDKPLSRLSPQEDFMLGMLLGYDPAQQCRRLLCRLGATTATRPDFLESVSPGGRVLAS